MDKCAMVERYEQVGERGQVLPLVALALVILLGAAALAVDVGYWRYSQRLQQSAADSAAVAGAAELAYPAAADVTTAARADAASNGFTNNGSTVTVTVNNPPASGAYTGNSKAVEVLVAASHPSIFAGIFHITTDTVTTRAVALIGASNRYNCLLDLATSGTLNLNGARVDASNCGIVTDEAMNLNGATVTAASIGEVNYGGSNNGGTFPEATPGPALPASDPCPMIPGCAYLKSNPPATSPCETSAQLATNPLNPGVLCGANFNGQTRTFSAGVYVITGGFNGNGSTLSGSGVTFYVASGSFNFNGATLNLSAPNSGNTTGILFYQVASDTSGENLNGSTGTLAGALYFPTASLNFNGINPGTYLLVIAHGLNMNGDNITLPSGSSFPGGINNPVLVE